MTEEITIDGVDVAGCGFRHKNTDNQCHIALAFSEDYGECWHCEQIENCYFKQLKRLEQENKINLSRAKDLNTELQILTDENFNLKQTLEEIKEIAKRAKSDICNNCGWYNTDSCEPQEYTCGEFIKIQNKIDEVLK